MTDVDYDNWHLRQWRQRDPLDKMLLVAGIGLLLGLLMFGMSGCRTVGPQQADPPDATWWTDGWPQDDWRDG